MTLRQDLEGKNLLAGDIGTVVAVYHSGQAYEVETLAANGHTVAVETLEADAIEPFAGSQILHADRSPRHDARVPRTRIRRDRGKLQRHHASARGL